MNERDFNHQMEQKYQSGVVSTNYNTSSNSETRDPTVQNASILVSKNHSALVGIINQLDPPSFVRLARTCRDLHTFCFNAKGICVPFGSRDQTKTFRFEVFSNVHGMRIGLVEHIHIRARRVTTDELKKIVKMPFRFEIKLTYIGCLNGEDEHRLLTEMLAFLQQFSHTRIHRIHVAVNSFDWVAFAQIVEDFHVKGVYFERNLTTPIPPDVFEFFISRLDSLDYRNYVSHDDVIISANASVLLLTEARISTETFRMLIKKFFTLCRWSTDFIYWDIGREHYDSSDPFIDVCLEAAKTITSEELTDWADMESCVLYRTFLEPLYFCFVREDGAHVTVTYDDRSVIFTME